MKGGVSLLTASMPLTLILPDLNYLKAGEGAFPVFQVYLGSPLGLSLDAVELTST
jgi:hypothetical protein